tara:strand:- start:12955 stop:14085 length:1131 start_codon:yes stop_codon:yes gene_type:complete
MNDVFYEEELDGLVGTNSSSNLSQDDTGVYPASNYFYNTNINKAALGVERNDLDFFELVGDIRLVNQTKVPSTYGLNQVQQTITGHSFEMDDTPGNERVLIKHNSGAGIELRPDGSCVITTKRDKVEVVGENLKLIVGGNVDIEYQGDVNMKVAGSFNLNCLDYTLTTGNNKNETVGGKETSNVKAGYLKTVVGHSSEYVTEGSVETILGTKTTFAKTGYQLNSENGISIATNDDLFMTAGDIMNLAADNTTVSGNNMTVMGGAGTIGGSGMLFSGNGAVFEAGVTAPTFHGDLDGTATTATVAQSQSYADPNGGGGVGSAGSITNTATPTITKPTADNVLTYLTKTAGGIRKVLIDKGNFIKRYIDPGENNGGLS